LMEQHALTIADLGLRSTKLSTRKGNKVATKYSNSVTGETWSGRGLQPKWLKTALENGRQLSDFLI
jgi:DNA-binding protein H-NS